MHEDCPYSCRPNTFKYTARYASALRCQLKSLAMQFLRSAFHLAWSWYRPIARCIAACRFAAVMPWNAKPLALPSLRVSGVQSTTESARPPVAWTIGGEAERWLYNWFRAQGSKRDGKNG